eukprot:TRINITY_DN21130_c0_g2_i1.p1 TRINITY_DN21130_c0_g2~~TRINITY_DN21130_c0_g2_i1.p1  ORF type:complete len:933 (-),score=207.00 TRINITY_DN21130_c0_g2_i1:206-3004(-)
MLPPPSPAFQVVERFVAKREAELGHLAWYAAHVEAYREANLPQLGQTTYLDYAGAALYSKAQIEATSQEMMRSLMLNPHSSLAMEERLTEARREVLEMFGVSESTHSLVFTSGATQALQLVGEHFAFSSGSKFVYADETHTSVVGLRACAQRAGAECGTYALEDLEKLEGAIEDFARPLEEKAAAWRGGAASDATAKGSRDISLLAVTGESNFSGVRADLNCINKMRKRDTHRRWYTLLDAAKLVCSPGVLDLRRVQADFTVMSFYKMFGYPTGLGALIVRHDAAHALNADRSEAGTYFGGGSVSSISAKSGFVVPKPNLTERLERGTQHFLGIAALPIQMAVVRELGSDELRRRHCMAVCREAYLRMERLTHSSGRKLCKIFGRHERPDWQHSQGPTIAFVMTFADGAPLPYALVMKQAANREILLRAGCHCNAGACQRYLDISDADVRRQYAAGKVCGDDFSMFEGKPTGALRISFGVYSTLGDVRRWLAFLEEEFLNRASDEATAVSSEAPQGSLDLPSEADAAVKGVSSAPRPVDLHTSAATPVGAAWEAETPISVVSATPMSLVSASPSSLAPQFVPSSLTLPAQTLRRQTSGGQIVGLKVYPIKGCGPLRVRRWPIDPRTGGFLLDRRWCLQLAPKDGQRPKSSRSLLVSAKQAPGLTRVRFAIKGLRSETPELVLTSLGLCGSSGAVAPFRLPLSSADAQLLRDCDAAVEDDIDLDRSPDHALNAAVSGAAMDEVGRSDDVAAASWFQSLLELPELKLVTAADEGAGTGEAPAIASHFANSPNTLLLVSTASLREFGRLCGLPTPADRFRANLEVDLEPAFVEASWPQGHALQVGQSTFEASGRCVRCQAVDIDPDSGQATGPSLLAALATAKPGGGKGPTFGVLLRYPGAQGEKPQEHSAQVRRGNGGSPTTATTVLEVGQVVR